MSYAHFYVGEEKAVVSNNETTKKSSAIVIRVKLICGIQNKQGILINPGCDAMQFGFRKYIFRVV